MLNKPRAAALCHPGSAHHWAPRPPRPQWVQALLHTWAVRAMDPTQLHLPSVSTALPRGSSVQVFHDLQLLPLITAVNLHLLSLLSAAHSHAHTQLAEPGLSPSLSPHSNLQLSAH